MLAAHDVVLVVGVAAAALLSVTAVVRVLLQLGWIGAVFILPVSLYECVTMGALASTHGADIHQITSMFYLQRFTWRAGR